MVKLNELDLDAHSHLETDEWDLPVNLTNWLLKNNFKKIGDGIYSEVFGSDTQHFIVKINKGKIDQGYLDFAEFCHKNVGNKHLPDIGKIRKYKDWYIVFAERLRKTITPFSLGFDSAATMKEFFQIAYSKNIVFDKKSLIELFNYIMNKYSYKDLEDDMYSQDFKISYDSYIENTEYGNQLLEITNTICKFCHENNVNARKLDVHHQNIMVDNNGILKIIDPVQ